MVGEVFAPFRVRAECINTVPDPSRRTELKRRATGRLFRNYLYYCPGVLGRRKKWPRPAAVENRQVAAPTNPASRGPGRQRAPTQRMNSRLGGILRSGIQSRPRISAAARNDPDP